MIKLIKSIWTIITCKHDPKPIYNKSDVGSFIGCVKCGKRLK